MLCRGMRKLSLPRIHIEIGLWQKGGGEVTIWKNSFTAVTNRRSRYRDGQSAGKKLAWGGGLGKIAGNVGFLIFSYGSSL